MTPETRDKLISDYRHTFASPEGLRVLADLSVRCRERQTVNASGMDGMALLTQLALNEGKRSVIIFIRQMLDPTPEKPMETAINE
jgi:hypothetical protein